MAKRSTTQQTINNLVNTNQPNNPNNYYAIQAKLNQRQKARDLKEQYVHKDYVTVNPQGKKPRGYVRIVAPLTLADKKAGIKTPTSIQMPKSEYDRIMGYLEKRQREAVIAERATQKRWDELQKQYQQAIKNHAIPKQIQYEHMINLRVGSENYLETIGQNGVTQPLFIGDDPQKILNQAIREIGKMQNQKGMNISPSRYLENMIWKYYREDIRKDASKKLSGKLSRKERKKYQEIIMTIPKAYTKIEQMRNNFAQIVQSWSIPNVSGVAAQKVMAMSGQSFADWYDDNVHNTTDKDLINIFNKGGTWQWDSNQLTDPQVIQNIINWLKSVGLI